MQSYTQKQLSIATENSPNTVQSWVQAGLLTPSIYNPKGRGSTRLYSGPDVTLAGILKLLTQHSFSRDSIRGVSDFYYGLEHKHYKGVIRTPEEIKRRLDPMVFDAHDETLFLRLVNHAHGGVMIWLELSQQRDFKFPCPMNLPSAKMEIIINVSSIKEGIRARLM